MPLAKTLGMVVLCVACLAARADMFTVYGWQTTDAVAGSATGGSPASLDCSTAGSPEALAPM